MDVKTTYFEMKGYKKHPQKRKRVIDYETMPSPGYFVIASKSDHTKIRIFKVTNENVDKTINKPGKKLDPSKLRAIEENNPKCVVEFKWKDNKRWVEVKPGTRITINDGYYDIYTFENRLQIEERFFTKRVKFSAKPQIRYYVPQRSSQ